MSDLFTTSYAMPLAEALRPATLVEEIGQDHDKSFTFQVRITGKVMGQGTGHSKKEAEQQAAREALARLN